MFKRLFGAGVGVLTALTAACDNAPSTLHVYAKTENLMNYVQSVSAGGPMLVQVYGNPYAGGKDALDAIVAQELENSMTPRLRGFHTTTDPQLAFRPEFRMILVLGAEKAQSGNALCEGIAPKLDLTADPVRMVAAFCFKSELLSQVNGSIGASNAPDGATFRQWVRQIGKELFQPG